MPPVRSVYYVGLFVPLVAEQRCVEAFAQLQCFL